MVEITQTLVCLVAHNRAISVGVAQKILMFLIHIFQEHRVVAMAGEGGGGGHFILEICDIFVK